VVRPLYGQGFFHVCWGVIWYTIVFDYDDPEGEYWRLLWGGEWKGEVEELASRMQEFLDEERMIINGEEARAIVEHVYIDVRGEVERSTAVFQVRIPYKPRRGRNTYEDYYKPERAEYPYTVTWIMPECGRILDYEMPGEARLGGGGRILEVRVRAGERIPGYESLVFELSECQGP